MMFCMFELENVRQRALKCKFLTCCVKWHLLMKICKYCSFNSLICKVVNSIKLLSLSKIIADKLPAYKNLVQPFDHNTRKYGNNHIERQNLTLRTHLKRLNRITICYSKSLTMLFVVVKIYFGVSV